MICGEEETDNHGKVTGAVAHQQATSSAGFAESGTALVTFLWLGYNTTTKGTHGEKFTSAHGSRVMESITVGKA